MKGFVRNNQYLSLCGLNCKLCPMSLAGHCSGCGVDNQSCKIARCSIEHEKIEYCFQCGSFPCDKYAHIDDFDSFITHQNQMNDMGKAQQIGIPAYNAEQEEKRKILDFLLASYNDGRRKNLFCIAVNLLEIGEIENILQAVKSDKELNRSVLIGGIFIAIMPTTAYITGALSNVYFFDELGKIAVDVVGNNIDRIIPVFINMALPEWFVYLFLLSLVAAAMSTISSQLHTQGTAFGIDICDSIVKKSKKIIDEITITRIGILIAIILALVLAYSLPGSVIALGTSLFFEICAAAFLPVFLGALYWKRTTKAGAIAGILSGTFVSLFWLLFVFEKTAAGLGLCQYLFGISTLLPAAPWPYIDVMLIAVPISAIFTIVVSLLTKPPAQEVIDKSFEDIDNNKGSGTQ